MSEVVEGNTQAATCALCLQEAVLKESHIIPKFVVKFAKRTSTGHLRDTISPNQRRQDGYKIHLLCGACELLLSRWENQFRDQVFLPLHDESQAARASIDYGPWCMKFAVSLVWRALQYLRQKRQNAFEHLPNRERTFFAAEQVWRDFILGYTSSPGSHEIRLYQMQGIVSLPLNTGIDYSRYLNRYLLRAQDIDVVTNDKSSIVYVKMLRVVILGFADAASPKHWGSRLHVRRGRFGHQSSGLSSMVENMFHYFNERASSMDKCDEALSDVQRKKIGETVQRAGSDVYKSDSQRARLFDFHLFGSEGGTEDPL